MNRVAIVGLGILCALGNDLDTTARALYRGESGIIADEERRQLGFLSPLTGRIRDFVPRFGLSRKQRKTLPEFAEWAVEACGQAIASSGLEPADLQNESTGLIFSNDSSCLAAVEQTGALLESRSTAALGSGLVFRSMTSCISMNLNTLLKTRGACWTISAACAGGGHAVGQAADLIRLGRQDRVLCGGAQEITWQSMCSFDGLGAFSRREDAPEEAVRPFDAERDGLVPSGGAAAILLERWDLAKARGADILGEVAGYGFSSDGWNISSPGNAGLKRSMRNALADARLTPGDISYLCAHATSTPAGDKAEAEDIAALFGPGSVPVSSTKSMTGHELWMSGASQVVYSCLMARNGFIAPNRNFHSPDEVTSALRVIDRTMEARLENILCNSAGFGGTNASLVLSFSGRSA